MAFWSNWFGGPKSPAASPRASFQDAGGGLVIATSQQLEEALRSGAVTASGTTVTPNSAMRVAAVYACVRIISGAVATLPLHIKRRVDERTRQDASDTPIWKVLRRRPNRWQTPSQFRRMLQAHQGRPLSHCEVTNAPPCSGITARHSSGLPGRHQAPFARRS